MKYIVVTGGVVSGIGKGITISSIGRLLKSSHLSVTAVKIDPYVNVDAGTMSPFEHGEAFVLNDGGETDLDLGNYERFLDVNLTARHNITTGKIYQEVIHRERRGDYLGKTVQLVPHASDLVQSWIKEVSRIPVDESGQVPDICLIEVGGTVGDIESMIFLEALRQFQFSVGQENIMFIHVSLVPALGSAEEQKTKPTQHSVKELRSAGMSPDVVVCRSKNKLDKATIAKISGFCHVATSNVLAVHDVSNIYHVPLILAAQNIHKIIRERLALQDIMRETPELSQWQMMADNVDIAAKNAKLTRDGISQLANKGPIKIALVGKYVGQQDAYLSVIKSFRHSAILLGPEVDVDISFVEASELEHHPDKQDDGSHTKAWDELKAADGICVPGGFGNRGTEGKILACRYARENKKPYLGLCLGMQVMVMEFARHVLNWDEANSTEFDDSCQHPVIIFMPEVNRNMMGGTMRLGARATVVKHRHSNGDRTLASRIYGTGDQSEAPDTPQSEAPTNLVVERHRHRYEVNIEKTAAIEEGGLIFTGTDERGERMEICELPQSKHPFFFGTQFHPEFKSRPNRPSPPFYGFLATCAGMQDKIEHGGKVWQQFESRALPALCDPILKSPLLSPNKKKRTCSDIE